MKRIGVRGFLVAAFFLAGLLPWTAYALVRFLTNSSFRLGAEEPANPAALWAAGAAGFAAAAALVWYGLDRWIIRPLEAMGSAARRIAEGDLDAVPLPASPVREIAETGEGFSVMVSGLGRAMERREELEEERRFFIGAIAHDLRTPLFALRGYLQGLEQGIAATPEQMAKYASVCREKSDQLDRLVSDLFVYAKTEFAQQKQEDGEADLAAVLRAAVDGIRGAAADKAISVRTEGGDGPRPIVGDAHLLERALSNLLDNAVRHAPFEGSVLVRCFSEEREVFVVVKDTGAGFSPSDLPRVFEPLYRGEASRSRDTGGAGLGLAIARRIFRAHGGELTAANAPEGGAVLTGRLPAAEPTP